MSVSARDLVQQATQQVEKDFPQMSSITKFIDAHTRLLDGILTVLTPEQRRQISLFITKP